jgi:hypothetical protein
MVAKLQVPGIRKEKRQGAMSLPLIRSVWIQHTTWHSGGSQQRFLLAFILPPFYRALRRRKGYNIYK